MAGNGNKCQFETVDRTAVPHTRKSKHTVLVGQILRELRSVRIRKALKIPRSALGKAKIEHIRAALARASSRENLTLGTSSDDKYFYVWRESGK